MKQGTPDLITRLNDPAASPTQGLVDLHMDVVAELERLLSIEGAYDDLEDYNDELRGRIESLKIDNKFLQKENTNLQAQRKDAEIPKEVKKGVAQQFVPEYDDLVEYNKLLKADAENLEVKDDGENR